MRAGGHEVVADAAVIAVPATVLDAIKFDPPLRPEKPARPLRPGRQAVRRAAGRRRRRASAFGPGRFWCYTQLGADGEPLRFVAAFAGSPGALESLDVVPGRSGGWRRCSGCARTWTSTRPRAALDLGRGSLGAGCVLGAVGDRRRSTPRGWRRPVGPLLFAGEHTAGAWHGLMEGALRSGVRAAQQLLQSALR